VRLGRLRRGQHALDAYLEHDLVDRRPEGQPGIAGDDVDRISGGLKAARVTTKTSLSDFALTFAVIRFAFLLLQILSEINVTHFNCRSMNEPYIVSSVPPEKLAELHRLMNEEVKEAAVFFMDVNGIITTWNRAAEVMKGFTPEDAIGSHLSMLYTDEDKALGWAAHNLQIAKEQGFYREERWRQRKDGSLFWARILLTALRDDSGEHVGFSKITLDLTDHKLLEGCVKEREETRRILRAAHAGRWTWHPDTNRIDVCENLLTLLGYAGEDSTISFDQWVTFIHPAQEQMVRAQIDSVLGGRPEQSLRLQIQMRQKDNSYRWFSWQAEWHQEVDDAPLVLQGICIDIEVLKAAEEEIVQKTRRLEFTLESAQIGDWDVDLVTGIWHRSFRHDQCFGYTEPVPDWGLETFIEHVHPDDRGWVKETFELAVTTLRDWHFECRVNWPDGSLHWIAAHGSAYGTDGQPTRMAGIVYNITERKFAEEKARHASLHDPLTGLPNRAMLFEYADHLLPHNRRMNRSAAVLFLDLDRFKPINDSHGHDTGDEVLKEVAKRLSHSLREEDIVIRLGGDEFVILLQDLGRASYAREVANHLITKINEPFQAGELMLSLSTSIGISIFPEDGQDIGTLISHADTAMYQAKQAGRNNFQFYSADFMKSTRLQISIEQQLRSALRTDAFHLFYQPVIDLHTNEVISVEALLRWKNMDVGPDRFVPIAEATGIINPIGRWVLTEATRQHKAWIANGLPPIPISVNVSVVEFRDKDFVPRFERLIRDAQILPTALHLEVTETAVMDDIEHAILVLSKLKALGITILLDDFGTGHSSLAYLARLPLNKVKIDKSFISNLESDLASRAVTDAMLALSHTLGLQVVAEGIDSPSTLEYMRSRNCQQGQGFLFSKPVSQRSFQDWYFARKSKRHFES
jgi:diguanylate cyclase (GGDEF)-like protein/PAS domain S-box-containing protein